MRAPFRRLRRTLVPVVVALAAHSCAGEPTGLGDEPQRDGRLTLAITGLPTGVSANVTITGPDGVSRTATTSTQLDQLARGRWTIAAGPAATALDRWAPSPTRQEVDLGAVANATANVAYAIASARLAVHVSGLPSGVAAVVSIAGPAGFTRALTGSAELGLLVPGTYTINVADVTSGGHTYRAAATTALTLAASTTPVQVAVAYGATTGAMTIAVAGLPDRASPDILLTGPGGFSRQLAAPTKLEGLAPGTYTVEAAPVTTAVGRWDAAPASQQVTVTAGADTPTTVSYAIATARLAVNVVGLPAGTAASATVSGPGGFARAVGSSTTLELLAPGTYVVTASPVAAGGRTYLPSPTSMSVALAASTTTQQVTITYAAGVGTLAVVVGGLPAGTDAAVTVTGEGGFTRSVTASTTIEGLSPGTYTVATMSVTTSAGRWDATRATQQVVVSVGATTTAAVEYAVATARLAISIDGLPTGVSANVTVTGPGGFARTLAASATLELLAPGSYTVTAAAVTSGGVRYDPVPANTTLSLVASSSLQSTGISYAAGTGALAVGINGLPDGVAGAVTVSGAGGFARTLTATATLAGLAPGTYTVAATAVTTSTGRWEPSPPTQSVTVVAGATATASVNHAIVTGRLAIVVAGLRSGLAASIAVTGPGGFATTLTASDTLELLAPGTYQYAPAAVSSEGITWSPTPSTPTSIAVAASATVQRVDVTYAATTGALAVSVTGLPSGASAAVRVTGPGGFMRSLTGSATLDGLVPGTYTVDGAPVATSNGRWDAAPASQQVTVSAGATAPASVTYALATARLSLTIRGLPAGTAASVAVSGPNGYSRQVTESTTLELLAPGTYTIAATQVTAGGRTYMPTPVSTSVALVASETEHPVTIDYVVRTGALAVTVSGLPSATNAAVAVSGPDGFARDLVATTTLDALTPGTYTVAAASVTTATDRWDATPRSQAAAVAAGATATALVSYAVATARLAVTITGLPAGTPASVLVSRPDGYSRTLTETAMLDLLEPGAYTVSAATVAAGGQTYDPSPATSNLTLVASTTASSASVTYAPRTPPPAGEQWSVLATVNTGTGSGTVATISTPGRARAVFLQLVPSAGSGAASPALHARGVAMRNGASTIQYGVQGSVSVSGSHGLNRGYIRNDCALLLPSANGDGTTRGRLTVRMTDTGVTLDASEAFGQDVRVAVMVLGGTRFTDASVGTMIIRRNAATEDVALGFTPVAGRYVAGALYDYSNRAWSYPGEELTAATVVANHGGGFATGPSADQAFAWWGGSYEGGATSSWRDGALIYSESYRGDGPGQHWTLNGPITNGLRLNRITGGDGLVALVWAIASATDGLFTAGSTSLGAGGTTALGAHGGTPRAALLAMVPHLTGNVASYPAPSPDAHTTGFAARSDAGVTTQSAIAHLSQYVSGTRPATSHRTDADVLLEMAVGQTNGALAARHRLAFTATGATLSRLDASGAAIQAPSVRSRVGFVLIGR